MKQSHIIRDADTKADALASIANLNLEKPWRIIIERQTNRRTLSQNSLMWKWLNLVADHVRDHTGYESGEVHELLKKMFLMPKIIEIGGASTEVYSTKGLTTVEMSAYMDAIYRWATSELGMILPVPEDLGRAA